MIAAFVGGLFCLGCWALAQQFEPHSEQLREVVRQRDRLVAECRSVGLRAHYSIFDEPGYTVTLDDGRCEP